MQHANSKNDDVIERTRHVVRLMKALSRDRVLLEIADVEQLITLALAGMEQRGKSST